MHICESYIHTRYILLGNNWESLFDPSPYFGMIFCEKSNKDNFVNNIFASFYPILTPIPYFFRIVLNFCFYCKNFWNLICLFLRRIANFKYRYSDVLVNRHILGVNRQTKFQMFFENQNVHKNPDTSRV